MTSNFRNRLAVTLATTMLLALAAPHAVARPPHNLKIVVPYPPASGPDILSRLMADQIGRAQTPPWWWRTVPAAAP